MLIRSIQLSDYASVTQLLGNVMSESCFEETMEVFARQLSWDSELVLVALEDNQAVGMIMGIIENSKGYYYRIAADNHFQRRGIGKALIQSLKNRFVQRNVSQILITMDSHNEPLLPLYESLGYRNEDFLRTIKEISIVNG